MVAEIKGAANNVVAAATHRPATAAAQAGSAAPRAAETAAAADNVSLTKTAAELHALEKAVAETPDVDMDRVNRIRQSIADGNYQIDTDRLAGNLVRFEAMMSTGKSR